MSLMNRIRADQLDARKAKDANRIGLLTALIGEAGMVGKNAGNRESTDDEVTAVIRKFMKNANETLGVVQGDRADSIRNEIAILESYLPTQLSPDSLRDIIKTFLASNSGAKMGDVMKHLKESHAGLYDGKMASQIAKEELA